MRVVVIGGTGRVGSRVVSSLSGHGHDAISASPRSGVDSITGRGLAEVLRGADVVVDTVEVRSADMERAKSDLSTATRNIAEVGLRAGVRHHVLLSVVGTPDLQESGYFQVKAAQEERTRSGGLPFTIVRSTQFFDFLGTIADMGMVDGVIRVPPADMQPASIDDVAGAIGRLAVGEPVNDVRELGGAERSSMADFVARWLRRSDDPRPIATDDHATYAGAHITKSTLIPGNNAIILPSCLEEA
jgi:uncharacterized protein YbjT (DUF2867 family)